MDSGDVCSSAEKLVEQAGSLSQLGCGPVASNSDERPAGVDKHRVLHRPVASDSIAYYGAGQRLGAQRAAATGSARVRSGGQLRLAKLRPPRPSPRPRPRSPCSSQPDTSTRAQTTARDARHDSRRGEPGLGAHAQEEPARGRRRRRRHRLGRSRRPRQRRPRCVQPRTANANQTLTS